MLDVLPSVNTATTGGIFRIQRSVNNAAFAEVFSVGNMSNNPGINFKLNNNNVMYTGGGMNIFYSSSSGIGFYNQAGNISNMFMTNGGQLIIGGNQLTPEASAWLDIKGTSGVYKGFLTPRMTTAQRNGIASPATGLEIYNTETNTKDIYNGTAWVSQANQVTNWNVTGNTISAGEYFGTKNNQPIVFKTNTDADASAKAVILANGNVGIATETPEYKLDIAPAYMSNFTAARLKGDLMMWEKDGATDKDSWVIRFRGYGNIAPYPLQTASIYLDAYGTTELQGALQLSSSGIIRLGAQEGYYILTPKSSTGLTKLYSQGGEFIIGTNSVSSGIKLTNGYVQTSGNLFQLSNATTNVITVPAATHNVGIGTENPSAQLHTTGTVRFAGLASSAGTRYLVSDNDGNIGYTTTGGGNGNGFWTSNSNNISNTNDGWVSIGTSSAAVSDPDGNFKLYVQGGIRARKVKVDQSTWPDYVFEKEYQLPRLSDVDLFIKNNKHLPGIKSAAEINKEGLDLGENQAALLQKIEELTLYLIEQNKRIDEQQKQINQLTEQLQKDAAAGTTNR